MNEMSQAIATSATPLAGEQRGQVVTGRQKAKAYAPISLEDVHLYGGTDFTVYLHQPSEDRYVLYRDASIDFTEEDRLKLLKNKIRTVYVRTEDLDAYCEYVERNLDKVVHDTSISHEKRSAIVYDTAKYRIQKILEDPRSGKNVEKSQALVSNMVSYLTSDKMALFSVLNIVSYDYYTYTHSVNVATFAITLARASGIENHRELRLIGVGALLHDIGKSQISECIINKAGPLSDEEWVIMKKHPLIGAEMLSDKPSIQQASRDVVLQHHEKCNGLGYPFGLTKPEIADYAKIAAVTDVYDALTTKRCYKEAMPTFPALQIMKDKMNGHFDEDVFRRMVLMLHGDYSI